MQGATLCLIAMTGNRAWAQTAAPLTIDQAVTEAIEHNFTVAAERQNLGVADARVLTASLRPNPVLTASLMLPDATIFNNNVNPREGIVRGDVLLERGGKRDRRVEMAQAARDVTELQLQNTVRALALNVQSAFIDVQQAQSDLRLARESLAAFNEIVAINTERVRSGDLASVELARSHLAAMQFKNDVRKVDAKLAVGPDALQALAFRLRPDLNALEREQARSSADVRLQLVQGKIDYTLSAEFHRQAAPGSLTGNEWGLFVSAPIPIFNRNQGEAERARREARQAVARTTALQSDITSELRSAWDQFTAMRELVDTIEQQMLAQARDVRDTTGYSYRRGEASFIELLDAQRTFNDTMQSYNEARAEYARSLYTLDALTGGAHP